MKRKKAVPGADPMTLRDVDQRINTARTRIAETLQAEYDPSVTWVSTIVGLLGSVNLGSRITVEVYEINVTNRLVKAPQKMTFRKRYAVAVSLMRLDHKRIWREPMNGKPLNLRPAIEYAYRLLEAQSAIAAECQKTAQLLEISEALAGSINDDLLYTRASASVTPGTIRLSLLRDTFDPETAIKIDHAIAAVLGAP